jgi:hypothetical protein
MKVRTIRDVDEETWRIMKRLAEKKKIKMGLLLKMLVKEYEKIEAKELAPKKPILSEREAIELESFLKEIRKEYGFRV